MPAEVVQDGLPALALDIRRVLGFRIECRLYEDCAIALDELGRGFPSVGHPVFDGLPRHDAGVRALEVEGRAAVLCLHARQELATLAQIDGAPGGVPVTLRGIPLLDVRRVGPPFDK